MLLVLQKVTNCSCSHTEILKVGRAPFYSGTRFKTVIFARLHIYIVYRLIMFSRCMLHFLIDFQASQDGLVLTLRFPAWQTWQSNLIIVRSFSVYVHVIWPTVSSRRVWSRTWALRGKMASRNIIIQWIITC